MDEWIKKMWYICIMELYSTIKNEIICRKEDGTGDHHGK
jgi:hypothetical protein